MKHAALAVCLSTGWISMAHAQVLHLASCEQPVVLRQAQVAQPQLMSAAGSAGVKLTSEATGVRLQCPQPTSKNKTRSGNSQSSSNVVITGVRINRAVGPGAVAEQNIGGQSSVSRGSGSDANEQPVVITVPTGWRVQARGWTGSLRTEGGVWQADVEVAAGEMSFARLQDSRVVVDAGSVSAQSLAGRLDAHVRGAGDIEVERSNDAALNLQLTGAGSMSFKGRAASAQVRASGVGSIEIEQVLAEPRIQVSGLATVDIGR
jgi:hypothetical protein